MGFEAPDLRDICKLALIASPNGHHFTHSSKVREEIQVTETLFKYKSVVRRLRLSVPLFIINKGLKGNSLAGLKSFTLARHQR